MEFGPMSVRVKILLASEPSAENLESMEAAAKSLTDDAKSVMATIQIQELFHELVADFVGLDLLEDGDRFLQRGDRWIKVALGCLELAPHR